MAGILDAKSIGPVDVAVVGFEGDAFTGEIAPALLDLVEAGTIRVIDLAFIRKSADGEPSFVEMVDSDVSQAYANVSDDQFDLLNDVDLESMADGLEPATAALVIVYENTWAARLAAAVRDSGGFLIAQERVPRDNVVAAIEALTAG
jgi:hypothetical protein